MRNLIALIWVSCSVYVIVKCIVMNVGLLHSSQFFDDQKDIAIGLYVTFWVVGVLLPIIYALSIHVECQNKFASIMWCIFGSYDDDYVAAMKERYDETGTNTDEFEDRLWNWSVLMKNKHYDGAVKTQAWHMSNDSLVRKVDATPFILLIIFISMVIHAKTNTDALVVLHYYFVPFITFILCFGILEKLPRVVWSMFSKVGMTKIATIGRLSKSAVEKSTKKAHNGGDLFDLRKRV